MSGHEAESWEIIDRRDPGHLKAFIADKVSIEDFPFAIQMPSPPFAFGRVGILVARDMSDLGGHEYVSRLIIAAPKLLAACRHYLKQYQASHGNDIKGETPRIMFEAVTEVEGQKGESDGT